jgi:hypothetical protein
MSHLDRDGGDENEQLFSRSFSRQSKSFCVGDGLEQLVPVGQKTSINRMQDILNCSLKYCYIQAFKII